MHIELREPKSQREFDEYYDLRWRILRKPWNQSRESVQDERDGSAIHSGAREGERLAGVGRLHFNSPAEAQVRYMAVEEGLGGQGVGSLILRELEVRARQGGATRVVLNAREKAVPFYRRHGYQLMELSPTLLFDSIVHRWMWKDLQNF